MKIRIFILLSIFILLGTVLTVSAQTDSVFGQISASSGNSFAGGMSGDGRLVVFESNGNLATDNPRNEDRNREIFVSKAGLHEFGANQYQQNLHV